LTRRRRRRGRLICKFRSCERHRRREPASCETQGGSLTCNLKATMRIAASTSS
jgi:hypothetical protein